MSPLKHPINAERPAASQCGHHWLLESPAGKTSAGTCKKCGVTREFYNSLESADYLRSERSDWLALGESR